MITRVKSMGLFGMDAYLVDVEVDFLKMLPAFEIVGLPDAAIKESRDRVRYAIKNCGYRFPDAKVSVNLAPADIRKAGPLYDVPICLGVLLASGQLTADIEGCAFIGELSFGGEVRGVNGVLPMVLHAREMGMRRIYVPADNVQEACVAEGVEIIPVEHINQLAGYLEGRLTPIAVLPVPPEQLGAELMPDFCEVKGQGGAKRALEIAAAGSHNVLLIGPPGSGKSMLAKRLPSILPDMSFEESIESTKIHSIAGMLGAETHLVRTRPFRSPHHTVSPAGLSGGGSIPRPGEISLAHNGVLFLDELPEFSRAAMEILRQPIEDGKVSISRANGTLSYPCSVMLVAAMNPCPCGYFGHPTHPCTCSSGQVTKYLSRVSGPLLDRLDLHVDVAPVEFDSLTSEEERETSAQIRERVNRARKLQQERFADSGVTANARMTPAQLGKFCPMQERAVKILRSAFDKLGMSARAYDRIVKVARTIADLDGAEVIGSTHIAEAIQYRSLDRKYWAR